MEQSADYIVAGVGPAEHLRQHGIAVATDLPVGDNLHDHMFVPMTYCMPSARNRGTTPYFVGGVVKEAIRGDTWMGRTVFEAVRGIDGLRVADASIMPSITGGNTNAPAMMIGEHCAALMRATP
jgi:choline dehydrogenase-like flavoprotein